MRLYMKEQYCVDIRKKEERIKLIETLEGKGYTVDTTSFNREDIICGIFPIVVNITNKKINMMGNVTISAAAIRRGVLIGKEEFEQLLKSKE